MSNFDARPDVRVTGRELQVRAWSTRDSTVLAAAHAAVEQGDRLDEWLGRLVSIGAGAVTSASTHLDMARVDRALERLETEVGTTVEAATSRLTETVRQATHPETGEVARAAQSAVDRLALGVQRVLSGSEGLLPEATTRAVGQVTDRAISEIHRLLEQDRQQLARLVADDRDRVAVEIAKAVSAHTGDFGSVMTELRELLAVRATERAHDRSGPRKGLAYEQLVHGALHEVASSAGDGGADFTGSATGVDGSRKGDAVVVLRSLPGQVRRLVAEAKNRPGRPYTVTEWAAELDGALVAREADVAIGVCPNDQLPGQSGVHVIDSRRVVVGWDPDQGHLLTPTYLLMRVVAQQRRDNAPTAGHVEALVRTMVGTLTPLAEIQKQAKACHRAAEKITTAVIQVRDDLSARIDSVSESAAVDAA